MKKILVATAVAAAFGVSGVQAAEDITVDVAVIGAGGAGLSAAVEAANLGAKVVVVEKMGHGGRQHDPRRRRSQRHRARPLQAGQGRSGLR